MKTEYTLEELASVVNVFRDISGGDFWRQSYFYKHLKSHKEIEKDNQEMETAKNKAKELLGVYDSKKSFETAKPFINYAVLSPNILFSLKKLREMMYRVAGLKKGNLKDRLIAQKNILNNSDVPVQLKPLYKPVDIISYLKEHYTDFYRLDAKNDADISSRIVFTDTFFPDYIAVELLTKNGENKNLRFKEDTTLREILKESSILII